MPGLKRRSQRRPQRRLDWPRRERGTGKDPRGSGALIQWEPLDGPVGSRMGRSSSFRSGGRKLPRPPPSNADPASYVDLDDQRLTRQQSFPVPEPQIRVSAVSAALRANLARLSGTRRYKDFERFLIRDERKVSRASTGTIDNVLPLGARRATRSNLGCESYGEKWRLSDKYKMEYASRETKTPRLPVGSAARLHCLERSLSEYRASTSGITK